MFGKRKHVEEKAMMAEEERQQRTREGKFHGLYWLVPLWGFIFWLATLLGLLLWWIIDDNHRRYMADEATVVFISDVGAAHRELFIPGCALTFVFFTASLCLERWLRHVRRIPGALAKREKVVDIIAVIFGTLGGLALLLLSIFNAFQYSTAHWILTAVFVVCIALCAICQTLEVMWIERNHVQRRHLRRNAIVKLIIVSIAVAGAIVFGATYGACAGKLNKTGNITSRCNIIRSVTASFEWFIAFLFALFILSFVFDLWPAHKTRGHKFAPELVHRDAENTLHYHKDGRPGAPLGAPLNAPAPAHLHNEDSPRSSLGPQVVRPSEEMTQAERRY